jgi:topoisomerase-4 subunit A
LDGRLLVFALDELKLQANGGKGLTLMDVDSKEPLVSVASFGEVVTVLGSGRGGKPKEEVIKGNTLATHLGKRARKGRKVEGLMKVARVV